MSNNKKKLALSLAVLAVFVVFAFGSRVYGVDLTSQQLQDIATNCSSSKNTLNRLHSSDALLRVNMGQLYESISTKLMEGFNGRVGGNNINNSSLLAVYNNYNSDLDKFRTDYITYEKHLTAAMNIDCKSKPLEFFDAVKRARNDRIKVHGDVESLNQSLDSYRLAISQVEAKVIGGGL
ncbi:hypothetical protein HGB25_02205 [Candidatus Saccharibacteria bacterium]|nr:hypothetical protein [Candidatus Saccharibacteria bacterium]